MQDARAAGTGAAWAERRDGRSTHWSYIEHGSSSLSYWYHTK